MPATLLLQSHRHPLPFAWLGACIDSVRAWSTASGFEYRFLGDELFDPVDAGLLAKTRAQPVIATDLARLAWLRAGLEEGFERVVWCDADFLVFAPERLLLPDDSFALGREIWVQPDAGRGLRVYPKVHNACMMFRRDDWFLDFYHAAAERLLRLNRGAMPPQFIGPKLLSALHNILHCPVIETAGMLSPWVMRDLLDGDGAALRLLRQRSPQPPAGANLSASLVAHCGLGETEMRNLIERLYRSAI